MTGHGDRAPRPTPETRAGTVSSPQAPAAQAWNHGGAAARHPNGRIPPHHNRGGEHDGGSGRRMDGGISIGNGSVNGYGNGGGVRHGQEQYRGGFDGHRRGSRGHQGGYRHPGSPFLVPPPMPVFAPPPTQMFSPQLFYGSYYGPNIGYAQTEFVPSWYVVPPPQDAHHFVPYPTLHPVHPMFPCMEQQQAAPPPVVEEPKPAQPSAEKLEEKIRLQVEFYFSESNLCTDLHLKEQMDEQGWVPLTEIASFNIVKGLTTDFDLIIQSLTSSTEVEVQGGRIRRRVGWKKYLLPINRSFHAN